MNKQNFISCVKRKLSYRLCVNLILNFGLKRYGGTSKPADPSAYSKLQSCKSLSEILNHEGISEKFVVVGHDWGAVLAARFVKYYPDRVKFWASISVPPSPPAQVYLSNEDFIQMMRSKIPNLGYQIYFMSPESSEEMTKYYKTWLLNLFFQLGLELEKPIKDKLSDQKDEHSLLEGMLLKQVNSLKGILESVEVKDPETKYYLLEFKKGGMHGPLNWYRTRVIDAKDEIAAKLPISFSGNIPCLFICSDNDPAFPASIFNEGVKAKLFPTNNVNTVLVKGGGHFVLRHPESRDQVTKALGDWIDLQNSRKLQSSKL